MPQVPGKGVAAPLLPAFLSVPESEFGDGSEVWPLWEFQGWNWASYPSLCL